MSRLSTIEDNIYNKLEKSNSLTDYLIKGDTTLLENEVIADLIRNNFDIKKELEEYESLLTNNIQYEDTLEFRDLVRDRLNILYKNTKFLLNHPLQKTKMLILKLYEDERDRYKNEKETLKNHPKRFIAYLQFLHKIYIEGGRFDSNIDKLLADKYYFPDGVIGLKNVKDTNLRKVYELKIEKDKIIQQIKNDFVNILEDEIKHIKDYKDLIYTESESFGFRNRYNYKRYDQLLSQSEYIMNKGRALLQALEEINSLYGISDYEKYQKKIKNIIKY